MPLLTLLEAVNLALREEMARDGRVVVLGQDVGLKGGVFGVTRGLQAEYGELRVLDAPIAYVTGDLHASSEYRKAMIPVFTRRALEGALARA